MYNEAKKERTRQRQRRRAGYASKRKREIWGSEDGPDGILIRVPHDSCLCCAMLRHIAYPSSRTSLSRAPHLLTHLPCVSLAPLALARLLYRPNGCATVPNGVYLRYNYRGSFHSLKARTCARERSSRRYRQPPWRGAHREMRADISEPNIYRYPFLATGLALFRFLYDSAIAKAYS